jgi:HlyD family secretion protein
MILLYMSFNLKFPVTVSGQVEITNDSIYIVIPGIKHDLVREGQEINLRMDDYPYMDYGILRGKISSLSDIEYKDNSIRASAFLLNDLNRIKRQDLIPGMHGVGDIIVDRTPIIYRILKTN